MGGMFVGSAQAQEIFLQGGTQGAGIGAAVSFNSRLGAHVDVNAINLSHNFSFGGNRYQDDIRLRQGGVYADVFPLRDSGFRTTAGARFSDDELSGTSVPTNGTYTFAGRKVRALPGMYAVAKARYPTVMPYFGIGYGHQPASKGFGFIADLGVAYGIPKSSYTLSPQLAAKVGPVNSQLIATNGLQELRSEMSRYRWYPVIQVGVSYRF
ncbi:outer membrane insertion C [Ralstonia sp. AU12-08]|nr:outer membrane insertion C [Ralstonia sp. AU12-08]